MVEERKRPSQRVIPPLLTAGGRDISGQGNGTHFFFPGKKRRRGIKEGPVDFFFCRNPHFRIQKRTVGGHSPPKRKGDGEFGQRIRRGLKGGSRKGGGRGIFRKTTPEATESNGKGGFLQSRYQDSLPFRGGENSCCSIVVPGAVGEIC